MIITHNKKDLHLDHKETYKIVHKALSITFTTTTQKLKFKYYGFFQTIKLNLNTITKNNFNYVCTIDEIYDLKENVLKIHQSQFPYLIDNIKIIRIFNNLLGNIVGCEYAEGYQIEKNSYDSKNLVEIENLLI